jgi:tetratricopeptide (TPR) repeat protein
MLDLSLLGYQGEDTWQWQLRDQAGGLLAQHGVRLDQANAGFQLATDLYRHLWLLDAEPARRRRSERELLGRVGAYVAAEVLGPVGQAIASRAPVTVRVTVPSAAVGVLAIPLELADWGDGPLALHGTVFCYVPEVRAFGPELPGPGSELRMLAVFARPETSSALGLVGERRALVRIAQDDPIARGGQPADLRVLQYGATKDSVRGSLGEADGWDVIHLAGHGGPGRLYLEDENGGPEPVEASELLDWLAPCQGRTRLVVLSACESGVARAARIPRARRRPVRLPVATAATALGYEIARTLGCTVLATRYPVDDRFSVAFGRMWYEALLRDGHPADEAVRAVLPRAIRAAPDAPLTVATPILLGTADTGVRLPGGHARAPARRRAVMSGVPAEAESFTGRTRLLARIGNALAADSGTSGLIVLGMPGIGKTAALTEAAYRYGDTFEAVTWHRATRRDTARSLAGAMPGAEHHDDLAGFTRSIRSRRRLLVIDQAQLLLASTGTWRGDLGMLIAMLLEPGARSRVVLISDRQLPGLPPIVICCVVPMLSRSESEWLARELQEAGVADGTAASASPAGLPWLVCRGHPRLIEHCSTGTAEQIRRRTIRMDQAWEVTTPLAPAPSQARRLLGHRHPGSAITAWARERATELPTTEQRALCFLASIEQPDRTPGLTSLAWELLSRDTGVTAGPLDEAAALCEAAGLAERSADGRYLLHPAVAQAGRDLDREIRDGTVRGLYVIRNHLYQEAVNEPGASQETLGHYVASTVPYLMRLGFWEQASAACELAITHDQSPAMAGRLLPYDVQIVRAANGTRLEPAATLVYASLLRPLDEDRSLKVLTRLHGRAVQDGDDEMAMVTASSTATLLTRKDPQRAHEFLKLAQASSAAAGQPWFGVRLQNIAAEIRYQLGDWAGALAQAQAALDQLDGLAAAGTTPQGVNPHAERGAALTIAAASAAALGEHEQAGSYRGQLTGHDESSGQRAASQTQFNAIQELIQHGRMDEARTLLLAALSSFTEPGDTGDQGLILIQLAKVEHRRGHHDDAIALGRRALRASYAAAERLDAAAAHSSMANFLAAAPGRAAEEAPVHILAAAVIHMRVSQELLVIAPQVPALRALAWLTHCLARQPQLIPATFGELRQKLTESTGVDIAELLSGLDRIPVSLDPVSGGISFSRNAPGTEHPGDSVADTLCWAMNRPPPEELTDVDGHTDHWQPLIDAVISVAGDREAQASLRDVLDDYRGAGWAALADALDAFVADPGAFRPSPALPGAERKIVQRIMHAAQGVR